jgi:hypothetical protein
VHGVVKQPALLFSFAMRRGSIGMMLGVTASVCACARAQVSSSVETSPEASFVASLAEACPITSTDDAAARDACAERLGALASLKPSLAEPLFWGAQRTSTDGIGDARTTRLNPLVWLKMYLSLEMFTGDVRIEHTGGRTIVHAATRFRNRLDAGEYPYPFWHADEKWDSYQFARETVLFFEGGKLIGALRSAAQDRNRPASPRIFDGDWDKAGPSPRAVLYQRFFSKTNPHAVEVDRTFRAFEAESRQYHCATCHRPDNPAGQQQLAMLCYPNQALSSRHAIVRAIAERRMPPALANGDTAGIADETNREHLLELARAFESAADAALEAEASGNQPQGRTTAVPSK